MKKIYFYVVVFFCMFFVFGCSKNQDKRIEAIREIALLELSGNSQTEETPVEGPMFYTILLEEINKKTLALYRIYILSGGRYE